MTEDRADYAVWFVHTGTDKRFTFVDLETGRPTDPARTCRNFTAEGITQRIAALIPEIARRSGMDVTRIQGRKAELVPAGRMADAPASALFT